MFDNELHLNQLSQRQPVFSLRPTLTYSKRRLKQWLLMLHYLGMIFISLLYREILFSYMKCSAVISDRSNRALNVPLMVKIQNQRSPQVNLVFQSNLWCGGASCLLFSTNEQYLQQSEFCPPGMKSFQYIVVSQPSAQKCFV